MSLWWTWMVMRVSYLVLSTDPRSLVVMSISVLSRSRKNWLVLAIMRRSYLALVKASSESLVHIIWMPSRPTWIEDIRYTWEQRTSPLLDLFLNMWLTWAGKEFRKSISWKPDSWMVKAACRITECNDLWDSFSRASSQTSTFPSAVMGCSNSIVSPSRDETAKIRSYTWRRYFKDVTDLCCWADLKK